MFSGGGDRANSSALEGVSDGYGRPAIAMYIRNRTKKVKEKLNQMVEAEQTQTLL